MGQRQTALVTGASSGIGAAFARRLAVRGTDLVLTARRTERLEALAAELEEAHGVSARVITMDLGAHGGAAKLIAAVEALGAPIDLLVNNAGFGIYGRLVDTPIERVAEMLELNMTALTVLTHHFAKQMVARGGGRVLQVSSIGAFQPSPLYAAYSATKSYVLSMSAAANHELHGTGVSITTLCPGLTETEFHEVADHLKPGWMRVLSMTADEVAEIGLRAADAGRAVVTPGLANKLTGLMVKLIPRSWATAMAALTMKSSR